MIREPEKRQLIGREKPSVEAATEDLSERTSDGISFTLTTNCLRSTGNGALNTCSTLIRSVNLLKNRYV